MTREKGDDPLCMHVTGVQVKADRFVPPGEKVKKPKKPKKPKPPKKEK